MCTQTIFTGVIFLKHVPNSCLALTITKKMADIQFTRMHSGRKSSKKGNGRLLKDKRKAECYVLFIQSFTLHASKAFW